MADEVRKRGAWNGPAENPSAEIKHNPRPRNRRRRRPNGEQRPGDNRLRRKIEAGALSRSCRRSKVRRASRANADGPAPGSYPARERADAARVPVLDYRSAEPQTERFGRCRGPSVDERKFDSIFHGSIPSQFRHVLSICTSVDIANRSLLAQRPARARGAGPGGAGGRDANFPPEEE
ncbi:hypothetical protein EVAR_54882_1 [Eumeta japonica]|uniref:Uncharacterized protein n=1 Tax=Eumeta variegata TaxID=151549 RepID=A0A4C2A111_EUMVA|nr:hypothetical protein EVAR_54882_1 [Eumeta japonica]